MDWYNGGRDTIDFWVLNFDKNKKQKARFLAEHF